MDQLRPTASMLASVTDEREARLCVALGADVIDAKNPAAGALGALDHATVRAIRESVPDYLPVSATIGDPDDDPEAVARAVCAMAATGVDVVKIGLLPGIGTRAMLRRLADLDLSGVRLVGVLLVDRRRDLDLDLIPQARATGFAGLMLDTADKANGALPDLLPAATLRAFVSAAHGAGLFAGLAGSLRSEHVPYMLGFQPDILGFRGGLCRHGERAAAIDADAVRAVRSAIPGGAWGVPLQGGIARRQSEGAL